MVAVFTGLGAGVARGSGSTLGGAGLLGSASSGRAGENLMVNAATGNLVITRQDEFLTGRAADFGVSRTYNSLAEVHDGDNGDKWQLSTVRKVFGLTGTANASGSTIKRQAGDGSVVTYTWGTRGGVTAYWTTEGDGAHDKIQQNGSGQWVWTDGASQVSEVYEAIPGDAASHRILRQVDTLGQTLEFTYHDTTRLYRVTSGNGEFVQYNWDGTKVIQVEIGITDHATGQSRLVNRTYYTYDGSGRLGSVKIDLSPDDRSMVDGHTYSISYEYGANGLVSAMTQTDGSRTEISYDSAGRVYQLIERASSTDARMTTFSYGASGTTSYTDVTAPNGQTTRFEYAGNNLGPNTVWDWGYVGVDRQSAGTIDGEVAARYTSLGTPWWGPAAGFEAVAGQSYKLSLSLQAVAGHATSQALGLYGIYSNWGDAGDSSARIVSGPGQLEQWAGGLWRVVGLSATEPTRVEIIRTFDQTETASGNFYVDLPSGTRSGQQLDVAGATIERLSEQLHTAGNAIDWYHFGNATEQAAGTVNGAPAVNLSNASTGWSGTNASLSARRGDTYKFTLNLQAVPGSSGDQAFGIYGDASSWGANNLGHARIISGPGTLVQISGGFWRIDGLSTSTPTQIEVVRTFDRDETGGAYLYTDWAGGYRQGQQLLFSGPVLSRMTDYPANHRQLTRIIAPPAYSGATQQIQEFQYDPDGNLVRSIAPTGATTNYQYDAMGNVTLIDRPVGADVHRSYDAGNRLTLERSAGSDEVTTTSSATFHTSHAYDSYGQLRFTVTPDGRVTEYNYDGYGRLSITTEYLHDKYVGTENISETSMISWRNGLSDKTKSHLTTYTYDARGNLSYTYDYDSALANGNATVTDGYTLTYYTYDHWGRLLSSHRYGETGESYLYDGLDRVVASSSPTSGVTTVYFDDASTRTVMHLASGLNRTLTYNKAGDLVSEVESAVGANSANLQPDLLTWAYGRADVTSAAPIAGNAAYQYTAPANDYHPYVYTWTSAAAGETVRYRITLKGVGSTTMHRFGLYGATDGWGYRGNTDVVATIVSGPGRISDVSGDYAGLFQIDGISTTEETIIEVVRTYQVAQTAYAYFYPGGTDLVTAGTGVILSAPSLIKTATDASLAIGATTINSYDRLGRLRVSYDEFDNGNRTYFVYDNAGRKTAEIDDYGFLTEYRYDASNRLIGTSKYANNVPQAYLTELLDPNNTWTIAQLRPSAHSHDLHTWTIYDTGSQVLQTIDGSGAVTAYEYDASGRVVRTTVYGNRISVSGFATTPPTSPVSVSANSAIDAVTRTFYDRDGNVRGVLDGEGYLVQYYYDAGGRKIEEIRYPQAPGLYLGPTASFNDLVSYAAPASPAVRITRFVYDSRGLLRYQIDAQNQVTSYSYTWHTAKLTGTRVHFNPISVGSYDFATVRAAVTTHANDRVTTLTLDTAGRVVVSQDAAGTYTYYTYDGAGNVVKVRHGSNSVTEQITRKWYDARGNVRFSVDPQGFLTKYNYTVGGRLSAEMLYDTAVSVSDSTTIAQVAALATGGYTEKGYWYTNIGQLWREFDGTGAFTIYSYWGTGLLYGVDRGYDGSGNTDRAYTVYYYDAAGRRSIEFNALGDAEAYNRYFEHDAHGNQTRVIDGRSLSSYATYDRRGLLKTTTDGAGGVTQYAYNAFGEVTLVTDARGNAAVLNYYDTLGRLVQADDWSAATYHTYNRFGELTSTTRASATTSFQYDKMGRVTLITDALGNTESFTYNEVGDRVSATNKLGGTTTYVYDRRGLLVSETLPMSSVDQNGSLVASTVTNTYQYDARGNLKIETKAAGLAEVTVTEYKYDAANRLTERKDPAVHGYNGHTYFAYDARGNLTRKSHSSGHRTVYFYDDLDRVSVEIDATGAYTAYTYDANGNVASTKVYATVVSIPADGGSQEEAPAAPGGAYRETAFTYDGANRLLTSSVLGVTSGAFDGSWYSSSTGSLTTQYQYDGNGNVVKTIDPNGNATWAYYDVLNRKTAQIDALGYRTNWTYDADGNVIQEWRYANAGPIPPSTTAAPSLPTADTARDRVTTYTYDLAGNRKTETREGVLTHDGAGGHYAASVTVSYNYNGLGQVIRKEYHQSGDAVVYDYDQAGRLTQETKTAFTDYVGNSVTPIVQYSYDGLGNLTRTQASGSGAIHHRVTTYYYEGGKLRWTSDAAANHGSATDGKTTSYWYDSAGNVTFEYYTRYDSSGGYAGGKVYDGIFRVYDGMGRAVQQWNVTYANDSWSQTGPTTTTSYNAFGEVASIQVGSGTAQQSYYDNAGRLIRSNMGDGVWKLFGYDKNGNQTLSIASTGYNLAGLEAYGALSGLLGNTTVAYTFIDYDARGLAVNTWEANRELTTSLATTLHTQRAYNAFGDLAYEVNPRAGQTDYTYNTMGRLIRLEKPDQKVVDEAGNVNYYARPTEHFYYDLGGRLVAQRDANGNLTRYALLANTGYGGGQAQVRFEYHADGGVKQTRYDVHGDARTLIDEMGRTTYQDFDQLGRVIEVHNADSGLRDYYQYDGLGQQLRHYNNHYGSGNAEVTDYDVQGRVISSRALGGAPTTHSYAWYDAIGSFGGWQEVTTLANGRQSTEQTDLFGRTRYKSDLGGHVFNYNYDVAGRLYRLDHVGQASQYYEYYNTGKVKSIELYSPKTTYGYDALGNVTSQVTYDALYGTTQTLSAVYDSAGRMDYWSEAGTATTPAAGGSYTYDANGNVRQVVANHYMLDAAGSASGWVSDSLWYRYDAMNRVVISAGELSGGTIQRGTKGKQIYYNAAGQRTQVWTTGSFSASVTFFDPANGNNQWTQQVGYLADTREDYTYDSAGRLSQVSSASGYFDADAYVYATNPFGGNPQDYVYGPGGPGPVIAQFGYDILGRVTSQQDFPGSTVQSYSRAVTYDTAGRIATEDSSTLRWLGSSGSELHRNLTTYTYGTGYNDSPDAAASFTTKTWKNGSDGAVPDTSTVNSYQWWDGAVQSTVTHYPGSGAHTSTYNYNAFGQLTSVGIADGRPRTVTFRNSADGQAIRRDEADGNGSLGDPHEVYYRLGGRQLGTIGNNGTDNISYQGSIGARTGPLWPTPGPFRNGAGVGSAYADFGLDYDAINSYSQGSEAGSYQVRSGDSLQSIAQAMWGDASLWYKLAEANGLSGTVSLAEGRSLTIPPGVTRVHHNTSTLKPYDPAEVIGDTSPMAVSPKAKKGGCGAFGQILLTVVAVAVTVIAPFGGGVVAGIANSVLGSVVSQGLGLATGIQNKFDFKGVALAAIGAGVSGGIASQFGTGAVAGSQVAGDMLRGAAGSALTQGIGVATGLQNKFSWAGVAAAGVSASVFGAVERGLSAGKGSYSQQSGSWQWNEGASPSFGASFAGGSAALLASAATRSAMEGTSFGDNLVAGLPDVIGQAVGGAIGRSVNRAVAQARAAREEMASRGTSNGGVTAGEAVATELDVISTSPIDYLARRSRAAFGAELDDALAAFGRPIATQEDLAEFSGMVRSRVVRSLAKREQALTYTPKYTDGAVIPTSLQNYFIDENTLAVQESLFIDTYNSNPALYSEQQYADVMGAYQYNRGRIAEWNAIADREVINLISSVYSGVDVARGTYRIAVNGEHTFENYVAPAGALFGGLISNGAKIGGKLLSPILRTGAVDTAALRSEAAANIWQARRILAETRPELAVAERNSIIRAFDLQSLRVETLSTRASEFRYFDGIDAGLPGRWSTSQWIAEPADRIRFLALPNNQATRAATATLEPGTIVFRGGVAPQLRYGSNLTGGGLQTYNAAGPRAIFKELP